MTDRFVVRAVVVFLGLAALAVIVVAGLLANDEKDIPDFLTTTGGAVVGALAALLARTSSEVQDVNVTNKPNDPVPTTELGA